MNDKRYFLKKHAIQKRYFIISQDDEGLFD